MKTRSLILSILVVSALILSSCSITNKNMKSPNNLVKFEKSDFEFSGQVIGEGTQTRIFGVDWANLFSSKSGNIVEPSVFNIPVVGNLPIKSSASYALYDIMEKNPGYDVVFYPQYETKVTGLPIIFQKSHTKVTARLGKIK